MSDVILTALSDLLRALPIMRIVVVAINYLDAYGRDTDRDQDAERQETELLQSQPPKEVSP